VSFLRRTTVVRVFGVARGAVADVMDAHLETLSMVFLTTCWAVGYGWFEAVIGIGFLLGIPGAVNGKVQWYSFLGGLYSSYHLFLGFTISCLTFGVGFLKFNRMLYAKKRYLLFTSLASYPWALTVQDFAYFFFAPIFNAGNASLNSHAWTCGGLDLGCVTLADPWKADVPFIIPRWYGVTLLISFVLFFLAYRSALVNLLVTREVMKEIGFSEKTRFVTRSVTRPTIEPVHGPGDVVPERRVQSAPALCSATLPGGASPESSENRTPVEAEAPLQVTKIVDADREALVRKLRERLERNYG